jgi:DNA-binding NarL/FixJ family response regulator
VGRLGAADCAEATKISIKHLSGWQNARQHLPHDALIVTDAPADAEHLTATLRVLLGYNVPIRRASSLDAALGSLAEHQPAYVFIVEMSYPSIDAESSTAELRRAGYDGPVIVVCNDGSHASRTRLITGGASDVIHKDDLCSARIAEAFGRAPKPGKK